MKISKIAIALLLSLNTNAHSKPMPINYNDVELNLPTGALSISKIDDHKDTMIIHYSSNKLEKGIGISTFKNETNEFLKCEGFEELRDVFEGADKDSTCNQEMVRVLTNAILKGTDHGIWRGETYKVYYSVRPGTSILYIVKPNNKVIRVDSDFLDKAEMQAIISHFI